MKIFEMGNEAALWEREMEMERKVQSFEVLSRRQRDVAFAILFKEDAIAGQYFVQMRLFLLCLVLCGRSSSTNAAGS